MAKDEMIAKQIAEINQHIRDGVNQWADTMLMADADQWAVHLTYYPRDIVNACMIFQHICSNVGIKAGRIDEKKAEEYGKRLYIHTLGGFEKFAEWGLVRPGAQV